MRIDRLHIQNFLGIHSLEVDLETPVTLIAGHNGAGKSSVADALRLAFCGEAGRVRHKKDFGALVASTARDGRIVVDTEDARWDISVTGKSSQRPEIPEALPYVLDAQRFASLEAKGRRQFLSNLLGVCATPEVVATMVRERGCDRERFEQIKPLLRAGFDGAHQDCKMRATEAKGVWRHITGEAWGSSKGENWQPERPKHRPEDLEEREQALRRELETVSERLASDRAMATHAAQIDRWHALVTDVPELESELEALEATCERQKQDITALSAAAGSGGGMLSQFTCPDCGVQHRVRVSQSQIQKVPDDTADPHVDTHLVDLRARHNDTRRLVAMTRERLVKAQQARSLLEEWEGNNTSEVVDIDALTKQQNALQDEISALVAERERTRALLEAGVAAKDVHQQIVAWLKLSEAFAPDGIPGELLARTIKPINSRLRESAEASGWPQVAIDVDMSLTADGRRYELLAESEQWRTNAMIAEAIAHLSGLRFLVLDRMDILDLPSRAQCVQWLDQLARNYDTILVMATMKAPPTGLPASFSVIWLEDGRMVAPRREAA